ncbi:MAG: hypothetical protein JSS59_07275 [Proteobacteria bacterium]|uniref:hypothetical protein n=1 Tax=Rudaea sp. TaxID=2136325 RepID=UPI003782ECCA|nr:hypothetical protein [Pseudomonadota bacterium]
MLSLLGKELKDDSIIELLEDYDVDVIYAFDRFHENTPDVYWAAIRSIGVQFRFNERQALSTIFCYIAARDGFKAVAEDVVGVPIYKSFQLAEQACLANAAAYEASPTKSWLKVLGKSHHVHYEFGDGVLSLVTLMLPKEMNS